MTPDGWRSVRLGDVIATTVGGGTPTRSNRNYWGGTIPWATVKDFGSRVLLDTKEHITFEGLNNSSSNLLPEDTVVMATRMNVGALFRSGTPMAINQDLRGLFPTPSLSKDYLSYFLQSSGTALSRLATGTTVKGLRIDSLKFLPLALPPLPEQRKIAAILSSVDDAIEKTQAVIDQIQIVKRGLMEALFVRGIPGRHTQFKQSEIGDIPTEWTVVQLEELCSHVVDCLHRTPPYTDVGYPAIRTSDLLAGRLLLDKAKRVSRKTYLEQISRLEPTVGDVLYSREGTFGLAASVPPDVELCISQRMMHFRARPSIDPGFLMWLLNSPTVYRQAVNSVGGSTVGHVNIRSIRRFLVPLPEREEQTQLAAVLHSVSQVEVTSERALSGYQRAKRGLMSVLLTGELRVTPNREPE